MSIDGRSLTLRGAAGIAVLLVASCSKDLDVQVLQNPEGRLQIRAVDGSGHHPCLQSVSVARIVERREQPVWGLTLDPGESCLSEFAYPAPAPGYTMSQPGPPLQRGETFAVSVSGAGYGGRSTVLQFLINE